MNVIEMHNLFDVDPADERRTVRLLTTIRLKCHFKDDQIKATDGTSISPFNDTSCLKLQS